MSTHTTAARPTPAPATAPGHGGATVAEAIHVSRVFGKNETAVCALDDVSVTFARGRLTAIMGPSGSGKSTLMHCMADLDAPTSGRILIEGNDIDTLDDRHLTTLRRDHLGFVFQAYNLVPTLTAREHITQSLDIAGTDVDQAWFDTIVETPHLGDRLTDRPSELSGGQQQRMACARALVGRLSLVC